MPLNVRWSATNCLAQGILATSLFLEVLEHMQRKYHIRTYQKEEYCFINRPINGLHQAAASLKELNFSILCTKRANIHTSTAQKQAKAVGQPRIGFSTIPFGFFCLRRRT